MCCVPLGGLCILSLLQLQAWRESLLLACHRSWHPGKNNNSICKWEGGKRLPAFLLNLSRSLLLVEKETKNERLLVKNAGIFFVWCCNLVLQSCKKKSPKIAICKLADWMSRGEIKRRMAACGCIILHSSGRAQMKVPTGCTSCR